jgi:uncharacterized protein
VLGKEDHGHEHQQPKQRVAADFLPEQGHEQGSQARAADSAWTATTVTTTATGTPPVPTPSDGTRPRHGYDTAMDKPTPALDNGELDRLDRLLVAIDPEETMALEELDGFFAALACCPEPVPADEYMPLVLGAPADAALARLPAADADALTRLLSRHWNSVASQLYEGEGFAPVLAIDEQGQASGNVWAIGFVRGMAMRPDAWAAMDDDEEFADALDPLMRLVDEAEPEDGEPAEEIPESERAQVLDDMFVGVMDVYRFFQSQRERNLAPASPIRRAGVKVGRNDPCPCGSGRKFKSCCGRAANDQ